MANWFSTLRVQMMVGLLALVALFVISTLYSLKALQIEREDDVLLRLGGELRLVAQQLAMQAMNYKENAPRDYPTYFRDLRLYYRDLSSKTERLEDLTAAFAAARFPPEITGMDSTLTADLGRATQTTAGQLASTWRSFRAELQRQLGDDPEEPRLEWAAEHVIAAGPALEAGIEDLWRALQEGAAARQAAADRLHRIVLSLAGLLAAGILAWFYVRVLRPLEATVRGVRRIAAGDFRHQVPVSSRDEIGWLGAEFNRLSARLRSLFDLLTRLQQGSNLEETLRQMSETVPALMPLDWLGILFVDPDGQARLEVAYRAGRAEPVRRQRFPVQDSPLEACLREQRPQHIRDLRGIAGSSTRFRLMRLLNELGMRDAIFMPITHHSPVPGVLVFAARQADAYSAEHVELMSNLALVITLSFGKTLRLAEHARLAAIGQFASGIVHEIRNPLATITLALDHLKETELPEGAAKRVALAGAEVQRLGRLLDDILLFAKPVRLETMPTSLGRLLSEVIENQAEILEAKNLKIRLEGTAPETIADVDPDRLRQVLLNLLRNAIDASFPGGIIAVGIDLDRAANTIRLDMCNRGEPLEDATAAQVFDPFFSTKRQGTGLGLGIVRRLIEAHGGTVNLERRRDLICAQVRLPMPTSD